MIAVVASEPGSEPCAMNTVIGKRIATPLVPPSPGSTPMTRPSTTATKSIATLIGCSAVAKPPASCPNTSIYLKGEESRRVQEALRQGHAEAELEDREYDDRERDRDR